MVWYQVPYQCKTAINAYDGKYPRLGVVLLLCAGQLLDNTHKRDKKKEDKKFKRETFDKNIIIHSYTSHHNIIDRSVVWAFCIKKKTIDLRKSE